MKESSLIRRISAAAREANKRAKAAELVPLHPTEQRALNARARENVREDLEGLLKLADSRMQSGHSHFVLTGLGQKRSVYLATCEHNFLVLLLSRLGEIE